MTPSDTDPAALRPATIAARLERLPLSSWHRRTTALIGVGIFYEFFEIFSSAVLLGILRPQWGLSTVESSMVVASLFAGMFVGALVLGPQADRFGRKRMFILNATIYLSFALLVAMSTNLEFLVTARFLAGIGAGGMAVLVPTYVSELVPAKVRGRYVGFAMLFGFSAYPIVALIGAPLAHTQFLFDGWRWLMIVAASGLLLLPVFCKYLPESPRWLAERGRLTQANAVLDRIEDSIGRATQDSTETAALVPPPATPKATARDLFTRAYLSRTVTMSVVFSLGVMSYYGFATLAPVLLVSKGYSITQSLLYTGFIAFGYPLGALVAIWAAERMQRRTLVVASAIAITLTGLVFGFSTSQPVILCSGMLLAIASNVHGAAAMMYISEVFPTAIRATGVSFCYGIGRIVVVTLPFISLTLLETFGAIGVLGGSAVLAIIVCATVLTLGPRTNGLVLEQAAAPAHPTPATPTALATPHD